MGGDVGGDGEEFVVDSFDVGGVGGVVDVDFVGSGAAVLAGGEDGVDGVGCSGDDGGGVVVDGDGDAVDAAGARGLAQPRPAALRARTRCRDPLDRPADVRLEAGRLSPLEPVTAEVVP